MGGTRAHHKVETVASARHRALKGPRRSAVLVLRVLSRAARRGVVQLGPLSLPCAIGRGGIRALKREGDGATPRGRWQLRLVYYRPDKGTRPSTALAVQGLRPSDGWCDATGDRNYNRQVRHPYPASAEHLWRVDALYDVVIVLDYNERPRVHGRGSAIFMHLARAGFLPTEGCVALKARDLRTMLSRLPRRAYLVVP